MDLIISLSHTNTDNFFGCTDFYPKSAHLYLQNVYIMKPSFLIVFFLFLLLVNEAFSNSQRTFDFTLIKNRIVMKVETDNGILNLLFDTGSNLSMLDSTIASNLNLPFLSETYPHTTAGSIKAYNIEFHIFDEYKLSWVSTSMNYQSKLLNYPIHGLLGVHNILKKEFIDIDFENQKIHIGNSKPKLINSFYPIVLKNGNRSVSGLGSAFPSLPSIEGMMTFKNKSIEIDLLIDTGCHYDFALISQDSLIIKSFANKTEDYFLMNGDKTLIHFGNACISSKIKISCGYKPFIYDPSVFFIYNCESFGLIGIPTLKKCKRIIINWPEKVMYVKKLKA